MLYVNRINNNIILLIVISLFLLVASCRKKIENYNQFGYLTSSVETKHGLPDGKTIIYYKDGINVLQESNYKKGKLNGKSIRWYYNGGKEYEENYIADSLHGKKSTWNDKGLLIAEDNYNHGKLNGKCSKWYDNGQIQINAYYYNNLPDSVWYYYDYNGVEVGFGNFDKGTGVQIAVSPDNHEIMITSYVNGEKTNDTIELFTLKRYEQLKELTLKPHNVEAK